MPRHIKTISGRNVIEFDKGLFDEWCVYLTRNGRLRYAPRDKEYFLRLQQLAAVYGSSRIYNDFVCFYQKTTKSVDAGVLGLITELSAGYATDAEEMDVWFTVIYAGMIAEENKAGTKLKKRIKRLGMHQVLMEGLDAAYAATFSKGKSWSDLDNLMREKGF